jgi:hypothetical protein
MTVTLTKGLAAAHTRFARSMLGPGRTVAR